jgi:hypothetical protein
VELFVGAGWVVGAGFLLAPAFTLLTLPPAGSPLLAATTTPFFPIIFFTANSFFFFAPLLVEEPVVLPLFLLATDVDDASKTFSDPELSLNFLPALRRVEDFFGELTLFFLGDLALLLLFLFFNWSSFRNNDRSTKTNKKKHKIIYFPRL